MSISPDEIAKIFEDRGGEFLTSPSLISKKLKNIRAILFDWDGVFNDGSKGGNRQSGFSEVDSMGTNMLRFSQWLFHNKEMPVCGIITGADNFAAYDFAQREHFHKVYFKVSNKIESLNHMNEMLGIKPEEVLYVFDDIRREEGACGRYKNKPNVNNVISHYFRKYSVGRRLQPL